MIGPPFKNKRTKR